MTVFKAETIGVALMSFAENVEKTNRILAQERRIALLTDTFALQLSVVIRKTQRGRE